MSVSGISSNNLMYQASSGNLGKMRQDFQALDKALQSGDLSAAQKAFAQLQVDSPVAQAQNSSSTNTGTNTGSGAGNTMSSLFQSLGNALNNNDLTGAQNAFSQIQQQQASMRTQHHHGGGGALTQSGSTTGANGATGANTTTTGTNITTNSSSLTSALNSDIVSSISGISGSNINIQV